MLRTVHWIDTNNFVADQRVRVPLALAGEARLCYQSIYSFHSNWEELQERFRTQFSKIVNIREQLFHAWRSFHYDDNAETTDDYVQKI